MGEAAWFSLRSPRAKLPIYCLSLCIYLRSDGSGKLALFRGAGRQHYKGPSWLSRKGVGGRYLWAYAPTRRAEHVSRARLEPQAPTINIIIRFVPETQSSFHFLLVALLSHGLGDPSGSCPPRGAGPLGSTIGIETSTIGVETETFRVYNTPPFL
jgi:hypothetical protein